MTAAARALAPDKLFEKLRAEVIESLGYEAAALRPWQSAKVTALSLLNLEEDRLVQAGLSGQPVDPRAVASIYEQKEKLLHPVRGDGPEARSRADEEADAELTKLIDNVLASREFEADAKMQREEMAAAIAAQPISKAPESLVTVTKLTDPDAPPSNNSHVSYIDAEVLNEPEPEHPLRTHSLNNPKSEPRPRSPLTTSAYSPFAAWSAGQNGVKRWEPPEGF